MYSVLLTSNEHFFGEYNSFAFSTSNLASIFFIHYSSGLFSYSSVFICLAPHADEVHFLFPADIRAVG